EGGHVAAPTGGEVAAQVIDWGLNGVRLAGGVHPVAHHNAAWLAGVYGLGIFRHVLDEKITVTCQPLLPVGLPFLGGNLLDASPPDELRPATVTPTREGGPVFAIHP